MLNVVIFGPPGSGKGTQGQKIAEKYELEHVSTGELCRKAIHTNTHEGVIAKSYIDKGELVPDETIIDMLDSFLEKLPVGKGIIFDGYPRTVGQAAALTEIMKEHGTKVSVMLNLEVEREELLNRLAKRGETSGRSDDNSGTIQKRLEVYDERTLPVIDFYKKKRLYKAVQGVGDIEEIFDRACTILDKIKK
ncbi:adenylate kinase [Carboxylicivirga sp. N1Y90]|uniref:adenylate kinase n=1 Tax=Carboxylicivirga fragile TaxID=3417571 RepID=UPI003D356132|nr:adenylate kinase [Marinilabiliaceae bacterium N1Y90]